MLLPAPSMLMSSGMHTPSYTTSLIHILYIRMQLGLCRFTLLCGSSQSPRCWLMLAYSLLLLLGMLWNYFQVFLCFCDQHVPCCKISKTIGQCSLQFVVRVNYSCSPSSLKSPPWGCKLALYPPWKVPLLSCAWCGQYHSKSQRHDRKCTATHISTSAWRSLSLYIH